MSIKMYSLSRKEEFIDTITEIYYQEWAWHFNEEWGIKSQEEMKQEVIKERENTYIFLDMQDRFIGTAALLDEDLKWSDFSPWFTCLYIAPEFRGQWYATRIHDILLSSARDKDLNTLYLWTYSEREKNIYTHWWWDIIEKFIYHSDTWPKQSYTMTKKLWKK